MSGVRQDNRQSDRPPPPVRRVRDRGLEAAIAADRIALHYQPQIDVRSGRVVGVEALARWSGTIDSLHLFDRAANARLTERLSRHIQAKALRRAAEWTGPLAALALSLNCTAEDLLRDSYVDWLFAECRAAGFPPARLTLEITESSLVTDAALVAHRLHRLRDGGVSIAVDDFGTGYANLGYLTALPLDSLKVDGGLIAGLVDGERDRIVVRALVGLARELGLRVIVEGVETLEQLALVQSFGADLIQGFLVAPALDEAALAAFCAARESLAA